MAKAVLYQYFAAAGGDISAQLMLGWVSIGALLTVSQDNVFTTILPDLEGTGIAMDTEYQAVARLIWDTTVQPLTGIVRFFILSGYQDIAVTVAKHSASPITKMAIRTAIHNPPITSQGDI